VTVVLERDGVQETWIRTGIESSFIKVLIKDCGPEQITIEAAQQRFRARAFSQKQLSTLVDSGRMASEQLTGIAAAEAIDRRQALEHDIVKTKREVATAFQRVVQLWTAQADLTASTGIVQDLERRKDAVKQKLEDSGLSVENRRLLEEAPGYKAAQTMFQDVKQRIVADEAEIGLLLNKYPAINAGDWSKGAHFSEVNEFLAQVEVTRASISESINQIRSQLLALETSRAVFEAEFTKKLDVFVPRYKEVREQQANLKSIMEESVRLEKELEVAERQDRKNKEAVATFNGALADLEEGRKKLKQNTAEMRQILEDAAAKVAAMSDGSLRATVKFEAVPRQYVAALDKLCENQRVRDCWSNARSGSKPWFKRRMNGRRPLMRL
jgi:chromosome segregation protein